MKGKTPQLHYFLLSFFISFLAGGIGQIFTFSQIPIWYAGLNKPFFTPPNWVFGPVWTLLYITLAISLGIIFSKRKSVFKKWGIIFFLIQIILNSLWSIFFFGLHIPIIAFLDILGMLTFTVLTIYVFLKISKIAGYLLFPYLFWITFASLLNLFIIFLN
ncbi:MAG TPA: TspO/MBR family protein [Patescibacteria group bacterium]